MGNFVAYLWLDPTAVPFRTFSTEAVTKDHFHCRLISPLFFSNLFVYKMEENRKKNYWKTLFIIIQNECRDQPEQKPKILQVYLFKGIKEEAHVHICKAATSKGLC